MPHTCLPSFGMPQTYSAMNRGCFIPYPTFIKNVWGKTSMTEKPAHYRFEKQKHEQFMGAVEALGKALKEQGPAQTPKRHI